MTDDQQQEQSVQDTQFPPPSPPHIATPPVESITTKDVPNNLGQNINPLTIEISRRSFTKQLCNHNFPLVLFW